MPESEANIARLESFRLEIKSIVEKIKDVNATAAKVKDLDELDEEDMQLWEKHKEIFLAVQNLSSSSKVSELEDVRNQCFQLKDMVESSIQQAARQSKDSKVNFGAWLHNRNPLGFVDLTVDAMRDGDAAAILDLQSNLNNMSQLK